MINCLMHIATEKQRTCKLGTKPNSASSCAARVSPSAKTKGKSFCLREAHNTLQAYTTEMSEAVHKLIDGVELEDESVEDG
jgi:hypothetical protein